MRVAALYDIHGNLPALDAVLEELRPLQVDRIVVGGDVLPGPLAQQTLDRLLSLPLPVHFLRGNGELAVLEQIAGRVPAAVPERYRPGIRWCAEQLQDDEAFLATWPKTITIDLPHCGRVLFCHAMPRDENEIFTRQTDEELLRPVFDGLGAQLVVCGHTHMQFDRMVGITRVINAGSVGMPFGEPGAHWLLLGDEIELRRTAYDLERAAELIRASGHPEADEFVQHYLLQQPSEATMLAAFSRAAIKP